MTSEDIVIQQQPQVQYAPQLQPVAGANGANWMPLTVQAPVGCPPGLEYLTTLDRIIIKPQLFKVFHTSKNYRVLNSIGQDVYFAVEDINCCTCYWCGPRRPFQMKVLDNFQREIIQFVRPLRCQECCYPCCLQELEIQSPPGTTIGFIEQKWSLWDQKLEIQDAQRNPVLKIRGPCCGIPFCADVNFQINSLDESVQVGDITRHSVCCKQEPLTDPNEFSLTFPQDLDVKMKATIFGAAMLIEYITETQSTY